MNTLQQLRTERGDIQSKIDGLATTIGAEKRAMTEQEKTDFTGWQTRLSEIENEITPLEQLEAARSKRAADIPGAITGKKQSEEQRELQSYSLNNVLKARAKGEPLTGREKEFAEMVETRNSGNGVSSGKYAVPSELFAKRDYTATGTTTETLDQGGQLIPTDKPGLIEALGEYMILDKLGVRRLTGLTGNLELPKELTKPSATPKAETAAGADQSGLFDLVSLSPKRLPGYINYTHQMLVQPNLAIEPYVRQRLLESVAYAVQSNFLIGTGTSNAPTGVLTAILATGLQGVGGQVLESAGTLDWDTIVDLETLVDMNNALKESLAYVMNSKVRGTLKTTAKGASTNDHYLWNSSDPASPVNGYPAFVTNQIPSTSSGTNLTGGSATPVIFGNWNHSVLANWGDIFIDLVNANANSGYYQLVVNTFWDVAVLQTKSFAIVNDVTTSFWGGS